VPTVERQHLELSDEDYTNFAGPGLEEAIIPKFDMYVERQQFINQLWNELIISS
jgi:putative spermidine/putrescine transport system substrate-binding protein